MYGVETFSDEQILDLFREYLPPNTIVRNVRAEPYVNKSMQTPFVQQQIALGIYDEHNIYTDFLSAARVYAPFRMVDVCCDLLHSHFHGLTERHAEGLVRWTAAHEAHHLEEHHATTDIATEAEAEILCNAAVAAKYPDLFRIIHEVEFRSTAYQRVFARISTPKKVTS